MRFINYDPADRASWLALREECQKTGVGGSEIASIANIPGAYSSAYTEWAYRTGRLVRQDRESAYLEDGRDIEAIVQKRFEEASGLSVRHRYAIIVNEKYPHLFANVDGFVEGEDMGWEGKTYDVRSNKFDEGVPAPYVAQVTVYLAVTGRKRWVLSAWAYGQGTRHFFFTRDASDPKPEWATEKIVLTDEDLRAAETVAAEFMHHVETDTPPDFDGSEETSNTIKAIYPDALDYETRDLSGCLSNLMSLEEINRQIKDLERRAETEKQTLMEALGEAESGAAPGFKVTYKTTTSRRLDTASAKEALGSVLDPFFKQTATRVLRIAKAKV